LNYFSRGKRGRRFKIVMARWQFVHHKGGKGVYKTPVSWKLKKRRNNLGEGSRGDRNRGRRQGDCPAIGKIL